MVDGLMPATVQRIAREDAIPFLLAKHYARRIPSISFAFGLFRDGVLRGVCTYGTPPSHTLLKGVGGERWKTNVLEMNRLSCENTTNTASFLVGRSLRALPKPTYVVSYADTGAGHVGYVYQATNFLYTGLSSAWIDPAVEGFEGQHHATFAHGKTNDEMRAEFGDKVSFVQRSRKHRYIFLCGDRRQRAELLVDLRYKILPFPKGPTHKHETKCADVQGFLFSGSHDIEGGSQ